MNFDAVFDKYDVFICKKSSLYPYLNDEHDDLFKKITNFDSSDGVVIARKNGKSALFVDGRYIIAAKQFVDHDKFEILNYSIHNIVTWINDNVGLSKAIAYDACCYKISEIKKLSRMLKKYILKPIIIETENICNTFDIVMLSDNRSLENFHKISLDEMIVDNEKLQYIYDAIEKCMLDAYLLCDPSSIAWIFNVRNLSRMYVPVVLCYLLVTKDKKCIVYYDNSYNLGNSYKNINDIVVDIGQYERVGVCDQEAPAFLDICNNLVFVDNAIANHKVIKNDIQIANITKAALCDSIAIINLLHWLYTFARNVTEMHIVEKLHDFRKQNMFFLCESFKTIAAADENAAIVHYSPSKFYNKTLKNILLLDSGGQYFFGTTDTTRTLCINCATIEQKHAYTLVLKGHLALMNLKFPIGTTGGQIESIARQFLWNDEKDFNHSTGHGIGYMLNVHEGPCAISAQSNIELKPGMLLSNEPGYYVENSFGIRIENMIFVKKINDEWLGFEVISLVPFDKKLIDINMLTADEKKLIVDYNFKIMSAVDNKITENVKTWLYEYMVF